MLHICLFQGWLRLMFSITCPLLRGYHSCRETFLKALSEVSIKLEAFQIEWNLLDVIVGTETSQDVLSGWGQATYWYVWYSCNSSDFIYLTLHRNLIYVAFPVINYVYRNVWREFIILLFSIQNRKGEKLTSSSFRHNNKHLVAHNRIQTNTGSNTQYTNSLWDITLVFSESQFELSSESHI